MSVTLIDTLYNNYLKFSKKGDLFEVPVTFKSNENDEGETINLHVWATSEEEAEERAARQAQSMEKKKNRTLQEKTLGVILPVSHYKPRKITQAWKLWKDPCYQKAKQDVFAPSGYTAGTMIKLSIASILNQNKGEDSTPKVNTQFLIKAFKVNIITFFIWTSLVVIGLFFSILGFLYFGSDKFFLSWINPYIIAACVCLFIGFVNLTKTYRDHKTIKKSIKNLSQKIDPADEIEAENGR